jgi:hypothetical protein
LEPLGLALSEKQIPQIVETIRSVENQKKLWKPSGCAQAGAPSLFQSADTALAERLEVLYGPSRTSSLDPARFNNWYHLPAVRRIRRM